MFSVRTSAAQFGFAVMCMLCNQTFAEATTYSGTNTVTTYAPSTVSTKPRVTTRVRLTKQPEKVRYITRYVEVERAAPIKKPTTVKSYLATHPKVKGMAVGAGVGSAAGAITGLVTGRGIMRGALIGAGTGAGVGLIRTSNTLKRHPIARDVATGSLTGLGLGWAASDRCRNLSGAGLALGGAAGLATGLIKHGGF